MRMKKLMLSIIVSGSIVSWSLASAEVAWQICPAYSYIYKNGTWGVPSGYKGQKASRRNLNSPAGLKSVEIFTQPYSGPSVRCDYDGPNKKDEYDGFILMTGVGKATNKVSGDWEEVMSGVYICKNPGMKAPISPGDCVFQIQE